LILILIILILIIIILVVVVVVVGCCCCPHQRVHAKLQRVIIIPSSFLRVGVFSSRTRTRTRTRKITFRLLRAFQHLLQHSRAAFAHDDDDDDDDDACVREIDDISDAFWECVLYSGESAVGFSFIFSFDATLNNFFEETTPRFFVFFRRGCSLISLSALFFFSSSLGIHYYCTHTHTHARARKEEVILEALSSSSSSSSPLPPLSPPAWCEKRVKR
jgi:hypothetical protein